MNAKDKQSEDLNALVAALTKRVAELELERAKAKKDSSTSSKPPSSDIVKPKPKKKPGQRIFKSQPSPLCLTLACCAKRPFELPSAEAEAEVIVAGRVCL